MCFVQDSLGEKASQGSFVPHRRQDVLTTAIRRPEHPSRVRAAGAGVAIKQFFGSAPRTFRSSSSMPPEDLQQLTQQIRDQLEESITEKSDSTADGILQPDAVPVSVLDAITGTCTLRCSCQHKGELCCSLRERSRDG